MLITGLVFVLDSQTSSYFSLSLVYTVHHEEAQSCNENSLSLVLWQSRRNWSQAILIRFLEENRNFRFSFCGFFPDDFVDVMSYGECTSPVLVFCSLSACDISFTYSNTGNWVWNFNFSARDHSITDQITSIKADISNKAKNHNFILRKVAISIYDF